MKYYSLNNDFSSVERRIGGNKLAENYLIKAKLITNFISQFPYIRCVLISGSLSKNYMDKNSDIDYFIITAPNRLWIARLFFILTQKIIFFNNTKYLCFNYMIDTNAIELKDKSLFTATEIATVIPMYGGKYYLKFLRENQWIRQHYPNYPVHDVGNIPENNSWIKRLIEKCLNNQLGEWLDIYLMKTTEKRWQKNHEAKMFGKQGENLLINRHVAKAHFGGNFERILNLYEQKLKDFENKFGINLNE